MFKNLNKTKKLVFPILMGSTLLLAGCTDTAKDKAMDIARSAVVVAEEKADDFMDNHEYRTFPWEMFLTKEDRELLNQPEIPILPEIRFNSYPVVEAIEEANKIIEETNKYVNNYELYEKNIDDETIIGAPILEIYKKDEASGFFIERISDMYGRSYVYPEKIELVMLEQELINGEHEWVLHLEWRALQDSNEFLIYPLKIRLTDDFEYIEGLAKNPINSAVYTKPLTTDAVVENTSHQSFLDKWKEFERIFNQGIKANEDVSFDDTHLTAIVNDGIELETLKSMFLSNQGDLSSASFTGWKVHDKDADAISIYTLCIPVDHEGNVKSFEISYSRPYGNIIGIESIN